VDDAVERVREKLAAAGSLDDSVLVWAADHGEELGEHGVHGHARNVLTPVVWVPLVFRFPFPAEPAVRVATQVRNVDLPPTLLELAGSPSPRASRAAPSFLS
jgi:choline-sulfatase